MIAAELKLYKLFLYKKPASRLSQAEWNQHWEQHCDWRNSQGNFQVQTVLGNHRAKVDPKAPLHWGKQPSQARDTYFQRR